MKRSPRKPTAARTAAAPRGRPRSFDVDRALDRALTVFWRKGYEGASLPDLTRAMGINRPSLYAAFGNKASLFRKALDRYAAGPASFVCKALEAPTARAVVEELFRGTIAARRDAKNPPGCLFVTGALACGDAASCAKAELAARRKAGEDALRLRFERAVADRDLPPGSDPAALAQFITTVLRGMSVQSASGATAADLQSVANVALAAWPKAPSR